MSESILKIEVPDTYWVERNYILQVLFKEFLGIGIHVQPSLHEDTRITFGDGKVLVIADGLFATAKDEWLTAASLPRQPLAVWDLNSVNLKALTVCSSLPVIFGGHPSDTQFFYQSENEIYLGLDIFGSAFFMLTRYEEVVKVDRDQHDRFPASASLADQEGFLDRPIINEYLEILWACLKLLYPRLERKEYQFQIHLSHDVDEPFLYLLAGFPRLLRRCCGDLILRGSTVEMAKSITSWLQVASGKPDLDPYNTFDLIMGISEAHNLKSAFYFITDHIRGYDQRHYSMNHPLIHQLLSKISVRGHEVGLHTSYYTYLSATQTKKEFEILKRVCDKEGIHQQVWGGRQHYLRWQTPTTFRNWNDAGLDYDSTLVYADRIGFRCGTCYEFSTFDLLAHKPLSLKERPLCVMDSTVTAKSYMNLQISDGEAFNVMALIKDRCRLFRGIFTILWHNTELISLEKQLLYRDIINY